MSTTFAIYHNLTSGGALEHYRSILNRLKNNHKVKIFSEGSEHKFKNFITYLINAIYTSKKFSISMSTNLVDIDCLLIFHSWLIKSPYILRYSNLPKIYFCHEAPREFYDREYIDNMSIKERIVNLIRLPIKHIDYKNVKNANNLYVISNSYFSANEIQRVYGIKSKVIYPGIDLREFDRNITYEKRNKYIITVGAINKLKNQLDTIRIISTLPEASRPKLIIIGNGADSKYLENVRELALSKKVRIKILQNISRKSLIHFYRHALAFIYNPINEPFGIVILEAMASGLPIVSLGGSGGYLEILTKKCGLISYNKNYEEHISDITNMLTNKIYWNTYSTYNYKLSKKFSDNTMYKSILNYINKTLDI